MTIFENPLPPTPVLKTQRLILRPLVPADAPAIQRRFPRWEIVRYLNPRVPWPYPDDGAIRFIETCQGRDGTRREAPLVDPPEGRTGRADRLHQPLAR
jgi:RimJ/RimL family protein N-acetyltransferase